MLCVSPAQIQRVSVRMAEQNEFGTTEAFINTGHPFTVIFVLFVIAIPFLIAGTQRTTSFRKCADLFDGAWGP